MVTMTTGSPTVTCIVIVYNGEVYLDEAIRSVILQTSPDWELIVVDDGSSDGSRDIARRHVRADGRIRLVTHTDGLNHGMAAARNLGLSESRGTFVGFLDADDVWEATKVEEQLERFAQHPEVAMTYGRTLIWYSWDNTTRDDFFYALGVQPDQVQLPPVLFRQLLRNVYQTPTTCNALMRRSAIAEIGGFDESFTAMFEDQFFFAKLLLHFPVFVSDRCWAKYRQHEASTSAVSAAAGGDLLAHIRYLEHVRDYLREQRRSPSAHRKVNCGDRLALEKMLATLHLRRWKVRARKVVALRSRLRRLSDHRGSP
jgi:glycosyltransferase involved in cell wall biosynthesis